MPLIKKHNKILKPLWNVSIILLLCFCIQSCSEDQNESEYEQYNLVGPGPRLNAKQGDQLSDLIFQVRNPNGNPVSGIELVVSSITGDGSAQLHSNLTDNNGQVKVTWNLGQQYNQSLKISSKKFSNLNYTVSASVLYKYTKPQKLDDGVEVSDLEQRDAINEDLIYAGIDMIRKGQFKQMHSVLILLEGKLLFEEYFSGNDSNGQLINYDINTPHEQQSASKSFRSMLIGLAIENGFIQNTEVKLHTFFPELDYLKKNGKENITLEHVLTMSSGLEWNEWKEVPNDLSEMYAKPFNQWHLHVLEKPLKYDPGTKFVYNTGASIMLNRVIERATNMTLSQFTKLYFMDQTNSILLDNNENLQAKKLPRDMAKLGLLYWNKGKWNDKQLLSENWIVKSLEARFDVPEVGAQYGYQWWMRSLSTPKKSYNCHYASGNGGQFIMLFEELDLVVVFTGGNFGGGGHAFEMMIKYILPSFENTDN